MPGRRRRAPAADLSRAIVQFGRWRQGRIGRSRIPDRLWKLAVTVVGRHGVACTAAALKLDYYSLKRRLAETRSPVGDAGDSISPPENRPTVRTLELPRDSKFVPQVSQSH
jgi:hypothetical protein